MPRLAQFTGMKRRLSRGFLFVIVVVAFCGVSFSQAQDTTSCEVSGTVFDQHDALVPNIEVLFVNGTSYTSSRSDSEGKFAINMKPGRYEVLLRLPLEFWVYERSKITIDCKTRVSINLYALPMCVSYGCDRIGSSFDRFRRKDLPDSPELVIAHDARRVQGDKRRYTGTFLTYGPTTVHAREIVVDRQKRKVTALDGWIENGRSRSNFETQVIEFATEFLSGTIETENTSDRENRKRLKRLAETLKIQ